MSLKTKLTSLIMTFLLLASLLVVGVFAVKSTSFNVGGDIVFNAKGIEATITRVSTSGFTSDKTIGNEPGNILSDIVINNDKSADDIKNQFASWSGLNLEFEDGVTTATIVLTIKNTVTGENPDNYLDISASANATTINNAEISVKNSTGGTTALLQQNESETFTITFKVIDDEYSASLNGFVVNFNLQKKTLADIPTSEDVQAQNKIIVEKVDGQNYAQVKMVDPETTSGDITVPSYLKVDNEVYPVTHVADYGFTDRNTILAALAASEEELPNHYANLQEAGAKVENITLPDTITHIGQCAFASVMSLKSINIPEKVTSMGDGAFALTTSLESIEFETTPTITDILDQENSIPIPFYGSSIKSVVINKGDVFPGSFVNATALENVELGDGVTSIGTFAFCWCSKLTSITIPDSVTSIGVCAFASCGFTTITIPNSVTSIGVGAFTDCTSLTSITIPDGVTTIEIELFLNCTSLKTVTIPASVTSVGDYAFGYCSQLTTINYRGTEEQWNSITFGNEYTGELKNANKVYNYTGV